MDLDYTNIGCRISKRRKFLGINQITLATHVGISSNYLSGIECGKEKPSLEVFVKLCTVLQVTPDYFLMGNMYSSNVPQNIIDGLKLCSQEDLELVNVLVQHMVQKRGLEWNRDNFV